MAQTRLQRHSPRGPGARPEACQAEQYLHWLWMDAARAIGHGSSSWLPRRPASSMLDPRIVLRPLVCQLPPQSSRTGLESVEQANGLYCLGAFNLPRGQSS